MKQVRILLASGMFLFFFCTHDTPAQNFFKTNQPLVKMLGDTTFGTAAMITWKPGDKTTIHTHSAAFLYAMTDGKLQVNYSDGTKQMLEFKEGFSMFAPADKPHWTENVGKNTVKFLLVEFNEHPYKDMDKKM